MFQPHEPAFTLMELRMPVMKGIDVIEAVRRQSQGAKIVVLTGSGADEDIYRCLRAGVQSYWSKTCPESSFYKAIRIVHSGGRLIPGPVASRLSERLPEST